MNNLIYFTAGALSMFFLLNLNFGKKSKLKKKSWSRITSYEVSYDFDYGFSHKITIQETLYALFEILKRKTETDAQHLSGQLVSPGDYTVQSYTTLRFVHRSEK